MKKTIPLLIFGILLTLFFTGTTMADGAATWVSFTGQEEVIPRVGVVKSDPLETVVDVDILGMYVEEITKDGGAFQRISIPDYATTEQVGKPELPVIRKALEVPGSARVSVEVVNSSYKTLTGYRVFPFQVPLTDGQKEGPFTMDGEFYALDTWYPRDLAWIQGPSIWRDIRFVVLAVAPIAYNPQKGELRVYDSVRVRLTYEEGGVKNVLETDGGVSAGYEPMYRDNVINYDPESHYEADRDVDYLIIAKNRKFKRKIKRAIKQLHPGINIKAVTTNETGNTAQNIKDYIQNVYESSTPATLDFVVFVGDEDVIPLYQWQSEYNPSDYYPSDHWYACVAGDDMYADIGLARVCAKRRGHVNTYKQKFLNYQENGWVENVLLVAHREGYPGKYTACKEWIRTNILSGMNVTTAYGGAGAGNSDVKNAIESGQGIVNYRGHGSATSWSGWSQTGGSFTTSDAKALSNGNMTPVLFSIACNNAGIQGTAETLAEAFMLNRDGGSVSFLGATKPSYTIPNHDFDKLLFDAYFNEGIEEIAYILNDANFELLVLYGGSSSYAADNVRMYLWLGEPALKVKTGGGGPANVIFDQGPLTGTNGGCWYNVTGSQNFAEQFSFSADRTVEGINIFTCVSPQSGTVHIKILDDNMGDPNNYIYEEDRTPDSWVADPASGGYIVTCELQTPFTAGAGEVYWIGVSGNGFELGQYSVQTPGDGKMAQFSARNFSFHTTVGDMMFQLTGN